MNTSRLLTVLFVLALSPLFVLGGEYADGYYEDGYVYHADDGYWYSGDIPYTRERVTYTKPVYYYGSYYPYYQEYYYHKYARAYPAARPAVSTVSQVLDLAKRRDAALLKERGKQAEYNAASELIDKLGLAGNYRVEGYGTAVSYATPVRGGYGGGYNASALGNYGVSGNTLYGYSYSAALDAYNTMDLNALMQNYAQTVKNAQQLAGQAQGDITDVVKQFGSQVANAAEIRERGRALAAALSAGPSRVRVETRGTTFGQMPPVPVAPTAPVNPVVPPDPVPQLPGVGSATDDARWLAVTAKCAACHNGQERKGGFDVATFPYMDRVAQLRVIGRLTHADPSKRMPLREGGGPGEPLAGDELAEFVKRLK